MEYQFQLLDKDEATLAIEDANRVIKAARDMTKMKKEINRVEIKNG